MNKKINFKKAKLFLGSFAAMAILPATAVSCFYREDSTVLYAEKFISKDGNGFSAKEHLTNQAQYNKPNLVKFENDLITKSKLLKYNFSNFIYSPQNSVSVDNNNYLKDFKNLFTPNYKTEQLDINQANIDKIDNEAIRADALKNIKELNATLAEYLKGIKANKKEYKAIPPIFRSFSGLLEATQLTTDAFNSFKFPTVKPNGSIDKEIEDTDLKGYVKGIVEELKSYSSVKTFSFPKPEDEITEADVKAVIKHFLQDTPFYAEYLMNEAKYPTTTKDNASSKMFVWNNATKSGVFNYQVLTKLYNTIPSAVVQKTQRELFNSVSKFDFASVANDEVAATKKIYKMMFDNYKNYNVSLAADDKRGMALGFAPEYLITGVNPDALDDKGRPVQNDKYQVFNTSKGANGTIVSALSEEEQREFLAQPYNFFWSHLWLVNISELYKIQGSLRNSEQNLANFKKQLDEAKTSAEVKKANSLIKVTKSIIESAQAKIHEIELQIDAIKSYSTREILPAYENITKLQAKKDAGETLTLTDLSSLFDSQISFVKALIALKGGPELSAELVDKATIKGTDEEQAKIYNERIAKLSDIIKVMVNNATIAKDSMISKNAIVSAGIAQSFANLYKHITETVTNVYSLVDLYAQLLFANGGYQVQIVQGTNSALIADLEAQLANTKVQFEKDNLNEQIKHAKEGIYWLEVFDKASNKWVAFDVFRAYLSYKNPNAFPTYVGENYSVDNAFAASLSDQYSINKTFEQVAHVSASLKVENN
ncbi:hypothetical protein ACNQ2K_02115 [Mycoplasma sp. VS292A]|uniref:hypothetical protein n=1 Tax=Mycoplasma sp. VS292A TaxID=3401680 RepID=UPI003AAB0FA6